MVVRLAPVARPAAGSRWPSANRKAVAMTEDLPYRIRRSDRARRVRVSVDAHGAVEVVLPRRSPASAAPAAIEELRPWIERRLHAAAHCARRSPRAAPRCPTSAHRSRSPRSRAARARTARRTRCSCPPTPTRRGRRSSAGTPRRRARDRARASMRRRPRSARATRSCRSAASARAGARARRRGAMSFNWRLLLAPAPVLDYVVWHEACHLRVMDHSPRFWALVGRHCPATRSSAAGCAATERRWCCDPIGNRSPRGADGGRMNASVS